MIEKIILLEWIKQMEGKKKANEWTTKLQLNKTWRRSVNLDCSLNAQCLFREEREREREREREKERERDSRLNLGNFFPTGSKKEKKKREIMKSSRELNKIVFYIFCLMKKIIWQTILKRTFST